jgi:hypothetical protein
MADTRVEGRYAAVTRKRQVESASEAETANGSNHGNGKSLDCVEQPLTFPCKSARFERPEGGDFLEVGTDRERFQVGGDDHAHENTPPGDRGE